MVLIRVQRPTRRVPNNILFRMDSEEQIEEGNKQQYKFNLSCHKYLDRKKTSQVSDCLQELEKQYKRRNKLIRLANKSAAGWDIVNEYLSDELASGSEDEKRIKKAEQAAYGKEQMINTAGIYDQLMVHIHTLLSLLSLIRTQTNRSFQKQYHFIPRSTYPRFAIKKAAHATDICFACGLQGHWRADCRRVSAAKANQASTSRQPNSGGNQ